MTKTQLYNLHIFQNIFLFNTSNIISSSPDYIKEKSIIFFGRLGKDYFIDFKNNKHSKVYLRYWDLYCETWRINKIDYQILNIILFIIYNKENNIIKNFEKYIGNINIISNLDLKYTTNINTINYINNNIDYNNRYFKLKTLEK